MVKFIIIDSPSLRILRPMESECYLTAEHPAPLCVLFCGDVIFAIRISTLRWYQTYSELPTTQPQYLQYNLQAALQ
jgi:hypothetical protein